MNHDAVSGKTIVSHTNVQPMAPAQGQGNVFVQDHVRDGLERLTEHQVGYPFRRTPMRIIHLPIQRKLLLIVAGTIAVFTVALSAAVRQTRAIGRDAEHMYGRMTEPLHLLGDLEAQFVQTRVSIRDALLSRTPAERQQHVEIVKRLIGDVRLKSTAFEAFAKDDPQLRNLYHDYTVKLEAFIDVGGRVLAADAAGER